jgi:hypothetical protein
VDGYFYGGFAARNKASADRARILQ